MELDALGWCLLMVAAMSIGLSKAGFSGVSLISVYILTELFGGVKQVGVALPMLLLADIIVFPAFRKYGNWKEVWFLLPPTIVGGAAAVWVLTHFKDNEASMRPIVGVVILLMVILQVVRMWKPEQVHKLAMTKSFGMFAGLSGGLATVLANMAGPIQQLYLLSKKMEKMDLIGVGARFFLLVNFLKIPLYVEMDVMSRQTLMMNAIAIPAIILGVWSGKTLLQKVPQRLFENLIVVFALLASVRLLFF